MFLTAWVLGSWNFQITRTQKLRTRVVENIWCRSKSPFPPRNGRFQTPNAAEARNSCATYIADHVRTEPILKIIEESWVGLRWYSWDVQKWPFFGLFWKNRKTLESKCMALDGTDKSKLIECCIFTLRFLMLKSCATEQISITFWIESINHRH